MELVGRSAIVTGGAGGLGQATVRRLVALGLSVVVFDRRPEPAADLVEELGPRVVVVAGDVNDDADVETAIAAAQASGPLSVLVSTAGGGVGGGRTVGERLEPHPLDSFARTMSLNAVGTFNVARLVAAAMATNRPDDDGQRGVLVHTASIAAMEGQAGQVAYAAAKAAIVGMTLPMARDLAPLGHPRLHHRRRADGHAGDDAGARGGGERPDRGCALPRPHGSPRGVRPPGRGDRGEPVPQRRGDPSRRRPATGSGVNADGAFR